MIVSFYSLTVNIFSLPCFSSGEKMALTGAPCFSIHQLGCQGIQEGLLH